MLEMSLLLGVGTAVLRLQRDALSMVKWLRQTTNEYAPRYRPLTHSSCSIALGSMRAVSKRGPSALWYVREGCTFFFHLNVSHRASPSTNDRI